MSTAQTPSAGPELAAAVRRGVAWSTVNTLVLRLGTFAVGIVVARLLTPAEFGAFAVALTVQAILMALADLGLSTDLIRSEDPEKIAPTVGAVGLAAGVVLAGAMALTAPLVAGAMGSPRSGPVIALLSVTLLLAGAGVVPYAALQRRFAQRTLFIIAAIDFGVSTALTLGLLAAGAGVMSLAVGRVVAQTVTLVLQYVMAGMRPHIHVERALIRPVLSFGLPVAGANLLSWALLNIDNVVVARTLGTVALGYYALAFNVSSWPMTAIGQVVRSVALPGFSRVTPPGGHDGPQEPEPRAGGVGVARDPVLGQAMALAWAVALPAGALLALLAGPLIVVIYGRVWAPAAPVLVMLGLFGALRVVFDLFAAYLLARGASRQVLVVQAIWFLLLVPATILGARWYGLVGAGGAHLVVAVGAVLPLYAWFARRCGADLRPVAAAVWPPVVAMVPAAAVGWWVSSSLERPWLALLAGGVVAGAVYLAVLGRWLRSRLAPRRAAPVGVERTAPSLDGVAHASD